MRIFVRYCPCAVVPLVSVGAATNVARAQQNVSVSPEVKTDTLRRLELAKTWEMPKQNGFVSQKGMVGEKTLRNICNGKPDKNYAYTQENACSRYTDYMGVVSNLADMMPYFKTCSLDPTKEDCVDLVFHLARYGFYDYALAVIEAGYTTGRVGLAFYTRPGPLSLGLYDGDHTMQVQVADMGDISAILRSMCLAQRPGQVPDQCQLADAAGAAVSEREIAQAADQRSSAASQQQQEYADADSRVERAGAAQDARLNAISNAVSAVAASTPTIQETAAQNQANLQAMAVAAQQRQQAQEQARLAAEQSARATQATTTSARSALSNTNASSSPATVVSPSTPNPTNNPYSSTSAQGSYNPYTGTGSGSVQGSCTDMTASVQGTVKIGSDGWVSGYLTNNSNQTLYVSYTFKQNGAPSTAMANAGGTTIQGGQTVGGEGQGLYSTGADKNPPEIYWYAVLKSEHDKYGCAHKW